MMILKKVLVGENNVNSPSYIVPIGLESKIVLRTSKEKKKVAKEAIGIENA